MPNENIVLKPILQRALQNLLFVRKQHSKRSIFDRFLYSKKIFYAQWPYMFYGRIKSLLAIFPRDFVALYVLKTDAVTRRTSVQMTGRMNVYRGERVRVSLSVASVTFFQNGPKWKWRLSIGWHTRITTDGEMSDKYKFEPDASVDLVYVQTVYFYSALYV